LIKSVSLDHVRQADYRQSLVENKKTVTFEDKGFPAQSAAKRKLKQIDFQFEWERTARTRTEPRYEISLGKDGERRQES
jgi:hypothetical protein